MVSKVKGQPFGKVEGAPLWVLPLMMNVNVRFAGVSGVAAPADRLPFRHSVAGMDQNAAWLQMRDHEIGLCVQLQHHAVSIRILDI